MYSGQGSIGGHVSVKSRDKAYIPEGLRDFFSGQMVKHSLDAPASQTSHKSSGDNGVSCSCQDRQHNSGCIYHLPGGNAFIATAQFSPQADCLEHCALQHVVHDACPGSPNVGADLLSRGNPLYREWALHLQVVDQIWKRQISSPRRQMQRVRNISLSSSKMRLWVKMRWHTHGQTCCYMHSHR